MHLSCVKLQCSQWKSETTFTAVGTSYEVSKVLQWTVS